MMETSIHFNSLQSGNASYLPDLSSPQGTGTVFTTWICCWAEKLTVAFSRTRNMETGMENLLPLMSLHGTHSAFS